MNLPIDEFERDGAAPLRRALAPAMVRLLREGIEANLATPSTLAKVVSGSGDHGAFVEDFRTWTDNRAYRRFLFEFGLGEIAARLMRSGAARLHHDHMLTKEAGATAPTPWHQDQPYYNIEGRQTVSFWIPVDRVDRGSSLRFVAGSHKGPWLMPRSFADAQARWFPEGALADLPDIDADPAAWPILCWALEPGDLIAFHMLTLHSAGGTRRRRRVFSARFVGDDVTHAPRPWPTSPEFPGLEAELPAGAPLRHALFPILWPRAGAEGAP